MKLAYVLDQYPVLTETFVSGEIDALRALGHEVHVESRHAWADDARADRRRAAMRLTARHPLRAARDLGGRRRWRRAESVQPLRWLAPAAARIRAAGSEHIHVHFAAGAALDAMRIGALLHLPYSVMTHGHDLYATPANLAEKHARAAIAFSTCDASARDAPGEVHKLIMGVDPETFRRQGPHPGGRTVLAVGRLVEKKGFRYLVEAAASLDVRVLIVGDGPLREELAGHNVELLGARPHAEVRELLERADVVAVPSVIAADGDRDTMPLIAKEALAMEVPVVASDVGGLSELIRPAWGRLVAPGDPAALAAALTQLLALPVETRARMGAAGRAFVSEHCSVGGQVERLTTLIESTAQSQDAPKR